MCLFFSEETFRDGAWPIWLVGIFILEIDHMDEEQMKNREEGEWKKKMDQHSK